MRTPPRNRRNLLCYATTPLAPSSSSRAGKKDAARGRRSAEQECLPQHCIVYHPTLSVGSIQYLYKGVHQFERACATVTPCATVVMTCYWILLSLSTAIWFGRSSGATGLSSLGTGLAVYVHTLARTENLHPSMTYFRGEMSTCLNNVRTFLSTGRHIR